MFEIGKTYVINKAEWVKFVKNKYPDFAKVAEKIPPIFVEVKVLGKQDLSIDFKVVKQGLYNFNFVLNDEKEVNLSFDDAKAMEDFSNIFNEKMERDKLCLE